ncbi:CDP-diacylglycerol--glycerol-3-phosphate 3-phosphatidyltransferase [Faecalispora anaeroviscerum]|uniref:CDP-diacylglycerol--glycerol-3-phosphate 3-phosphatidyltransferase n=1 Tax=Faecalispora anaeroviscerum TaxID=2991836 RepID=UPI0024BB40D4|nr:CDP-diacylglycerol--glycerol-3-phosphate 3-phosphatidyltransferase [Faecalispora anaeroviscerum]
MNLPNKLTMLRLILVPFFVAVLLASALPHHSLIAAVLFAVASYTDHLDGMLARKYHQITDFGKFMDPLADKVLVISALVCFVELHLANVWFVLLIIAREFMVTSIRLVAADKGQVIAANNWGKAKTVSQIIAILAVLLLQYWQELTVAGVALPVAANEPLTSLLGQLLILVATVLSVVSGGIYLKQNWQIVKTAG